MIFKAMKSQNMEPQHVGLQDGQLKVCGSAPNCVCSLNSNDDSVHFIEPIQADSSEALNRQWDKLKATLPKLNIKILETSDFYIRGTATTALLRFVDDLEFHKRPDLNRIDLKSSSRVGYSDLGANRKRLRKILEAL